jgi:hypothetical protein
MHVGHRRQKQEESVSSRFGTTWPRRCGDEGGAFGDDSRKRCVRDQVGSQAMVAANATEVLELQYRVVLDVALFDSSNPILRDGHLPTSRSPLGQRQLRALSQCLQGMLSARCVKRIKSTNKSVN